MCDCLLTINKFGSEVIHFMVSYEEGSVRIFDVETFQFSHFEFPWPVRVSIMFTFSILTSTMII